MAIALQRRSHLVSKALHMPNQFSCCSKGFDLHRFIHDAISAIAIRQTPREREERPGYLRNGRPFDGRLTRSREILKDAVFSEIQEMIKMLALTP